MKFLVKKKHSVTAKKNVHLRIPVFETPLFSFIHAFLQMTTV